MMFIAYHLNEEKDVNYPKLYTMSRWTQLAVEFNLFSLLWIAFDAEV